MLPDNSADNLRDDILDLIITQIQAMRKDFEELEARLAKREQENKDDWLQKLQAKVQLAASSRRSLFCFICNNVSFYLRVIGGLNGRQSPRYRFYWSRRILSVPTRLCKERTWTVFRNFN